MNEFNLQEPEEFSVTASVSLAIGFATGCVVFVADWSAAERVFRWDSVILGGVIGAIVTAVLYAFGKLMSSPNFIDFVSMLACSKRPSKQKSVGEKVEKNQFVAPTPIGLAQNDAVPQWEMVMDKRLQHDGFLFVGNGRHVALPETFDIEHLYQIAEARHGKKLDVVSLRALAEIGISRDGVEPNAQTMINFLIDAGLLEAHSVNYRRKWTGVGERVFPFGIATPPPQQNGHSAENGGGVSTATTTAAAATTAATKAAAAS